jgi:hypothetical protein
LLLLLPLLLLVLGVPAKNDQEGNTNTGEAHEIQNKAPALLRQMQLTSRWQCSNCCCNAMSIAACCCIGYYHTQRCAAHYSLVDPLLHCCRLMSTTKQVAALDDTLHAPTLHAYAQGLD